MVVIIHSTLHILFGGMILSALLSCSFEEFTFLGPTAEEARRGAVAPRKSRGGAQRSYEEWSTWKDF